MNRRTFIVTAAGLLAARSPERPSRRAKELIGFEAALSQFESADD